MIATCRDPGSLLTWPLIEACPLARTTTEMHWTILDHDDTQSPDASLMAPFLRHAHAGSCQSCTDILRYFNQPLSELQELAALNSMAPASATLHTITHVARQGICLHH